MVERIKYIEIRQRRGKTQILRFGEGHRGGKRLIDITEVNPSELKQTLESNVFWEGTSKAPRGR